MDAKNENLESIKAFLEKLETDLAFRTKFEDAISRIHRENPENILTGMLDFINAEGFECSLKDLAALLHKAVALQSDELSDEELKEAVGGGEFLNGFFGAFRNIVKTLADSSQFFNKMIQELPKRLMDILPK